MFTGIVETLCSVESIRPTAEGSRLSVDLGPLKGKPAISESVCVQGVCLTVMERRGTGVGFDVVRETLSRTTLGDLRAGDRVNVEPSLCLGDSMGGHFVMGHVDGVATVVDAVRRKDSLEIAVRPPLDLLPFIAEKGSVTLDGVSLTVASMDRDRFRIAIVPYTTQVTTFGGCRNGSRLNLEVDVLARYVARWIQAGR